jgi:hypothetical protein
MEEKFNEVVQNGNRIASGRRRTVSKEEEKIDPNIMIQKSIK